jgi:ribosomal protein S27AE
MRTPLPFVGELCPRCGTEAKVDFSDHRLYCPNGTCAAYQKWNGTWTPGYGGEQAQTRGSK